MFELPSDDQNCDTWLPQKVSNIYCVLQVRIVFPRWRTVWQCIYLFITARILQVVRSLVAPTNPTQVTASCQNKMHLSGILQALCNILMANGVPVNILTESINAAADIIRGNYNNQEFFSTIQAPCNPPRWVGLFHTHMVWTSLGLNNVVIVDREALVILLMSMVNEKQPITLRCAVLYCFQCFLFKNEFGQSKLIQTLLPSTVEREYQRIMKIEVRRKRVVKRLSNQSWLSRRHHIDRSAFVCRTLQPRFCEQLVRRRRSLALTHRQSSSARTHVESDADAFGGKYSGVSSVHDYRAAAICELFASVTETN